MIPYKANLTHELPRTAELVIIGGGIVGAATAFFAARAGIQAVTIEKRPTLATLTTPAATGAFRAQFDNPEEMDLVREGIDLFTHFAEVAGLPGYDIGVRQQGYLWLSTTESTARRQRDLVQRQREWGLHDVELLSGDEARYRFPYLTPEVIQARYRAGDGWLDPRKLTMGYAIASRAPFVTETAVTGFELAGDRVTAVRTTRGTIATDQVVIAAGPFSGVIARMAGIELDLTLVRRQRMIMPEVPEVPSDAPMTIDEGTGAHWRPALHGANLLWTAPGIPGGPPLDDVPTSEDFAFGLLNPASDHAVARISPFWREVWQRNTCHWFLRAGQYTYTPDHRPYLGPTPIKGLYVNCGYSGHGIMASAGGSRLTIATLTGTISPADNPFRLDRPRQERDLDIL